MAIDRLMVFVSSTLSECAAERDAAQKAIRSLNLEPVLFELIGARPYTPREVYLPRLDASHVFVGVYRDEYGQIVPGLSVSGIEDEYLRATEKGLARLIYVRQDGSKREARLAALVEEARKTITTGRYDAPEDLVERIRDDLTALLSEAFVGQAVAKEAHKAAGETLAELLPVASQRLQRPGVEAALVQLVAEHRRVIVRGPLGAGKTVLLTQAAAANGWLYADARGLTRLEMVRLCANVLHQRLGEGERIYPTERAAQYALEEAWARAAGVVLVVDSVSDPSPLLELTSAMASSAHQSIVIVPAGEAATPRSEQFEVPPLAESEVRAYLTAMRGIAPEPGESASLVQRSAGNPLYLRFYALGAAAQGQASLEAVELSAVSALDATAKEVLAYLALAGHALPVADLRSLVGDGPGGSEAVSSSMARASGLLRQGDGVIDLVHAHLRETLLIDLAGSPARQGFLAHRLIAWLEAANDVATAFRIALRIGDRRTAKRIVGPAARQAALRGGGAPAIEVLRFQLEVARENESREDEVLALLGLAQALRQVGDLPGAISAVAGARPVANALGSKGYVAMVREVEIDLELQQAPTPALFEELGRLRAEYDEVGDGQAAGRVALLLSAHLIVRSRYVEAAAAAAIALERFRRSGDDYGVRIATVNLASAVSAIPERREEARELAASLEQAVEPTQQPRERAVVCNLLARRYRSQGRYELAESLGREAIAIGEGLGDQGVIANNRINVGNALRDQGRVDEAMVEYRIADSVASAAGLRSQEAAANELVASVLNDRREFALASTHARHAIGLARAAHDWDIEARALEELGRSLEGGASHREAAIAYAEAARAIGRSGARGGFLASLLAASLRICNEQRYGALRTWCVEMACKPDHQVLPPSQEKGQLDWEGICNAGLLITGRLRPQDVIANVSLLVSDILGTVPREIERQLVLRMVSAFQRTPTGTTDEAIAAGVCGALLASDFAHFSLQDWAGMADGVSGLLSRAYFRSHADGAAHWTIRLEAANGILLTIGQIDDSPQVAGSAMTLGLMFVALAPVVREAILGDDTLARSEVQIQIVSHGEFAKHVGPELSGLGPNLEHEFSVSVSTDLARSDQPPFFAILRDDFPDRWKPTVQRISNPHMLFGGVLERLASHLFAKEIDSDTLRPKVMSVMKRSRSRA